MLHNHAAIAFLILANQSPIAQIPEMRDTQKAQTDIPMVEDTELDKTIKPGTKPTGLSVKVPLGLYEAWNQQSS